MTDKQRLSIDAMEARIVDWCASRDLIRAAILTSTRAAANGPIDRFSDIDVILVLTEIGPLSEHRHWLIEFGEVLAAWRDEAALRRDLKSASHRAHIPTPPCREEFLALIEEFLLESTYVAKHLWRDDLMPAKFSLDHVMKQGCLRAMLEWRIEIDHQWSLKPGASGKGLKKLVSPEAYRSLEQTYVGPTIADNWIALFDTIALFRGVAIEVADHLGYQYPRDLPRSPVCDHAGAVDDRTIANALTARDTCICQEYDLSHP